MRSRIATITILSLVLLAVCCQVLPAGHMHDEMQTMPESTAHLALLTMNLPPPIIFLILLLVGMVWLTITHAAVQLDAAPQQPWRFGRPPDSLFISSLRLAFSDGILNPKRY